MYERGMGLIYDAMFLKEIIYYLCVYIYIYIYLTFEYLKIFVHFKDMQKFLIDKGYIDTTYDDNNFRRHSTLY